MSANIPARALGPVPENAPQSDWAAWLVQIAGLSNFLLKMIGTTPITAVGDAAYQIVQSDRLVEISAAFTAARIWTLPPANSVAPGYEIAIIDAIATITAANTLTVALSGADTIDGAAAPLVLNIAGSAVMLVSDGLSNWAAKTTRTTLSGAPANVYVATGANGGSDSNDGLSATVSGGHGPCATINHAISVGSQYLNTGGASLTVNVGAGSFTESVTVNYPLTGAVNVAANPNGTNLQPGQIMISGAGSGSTTLTGGGLNGTLIASNYAVVGVRAMTLLGNAHASQSTLFAQLGATINIYDDIIFGAASVDQIHIENAGSQVEAWYSYTIAGGALDHIAVGTNGVYLHNAYPGGVITLTGTPAFSRFIFAEESATVQFNSGVSFSGAATGSRYNINSGATLKTNGSASLTFLPGNAIGASNSGYYFGSSGELFEVSTAFTPGVTFGGAAVGVTYGTQLARYQKVGNRVFGEFTVTLTNKGASVGAAKITGLPFAADASLIGNCNITFYNNMAGITSWANFVNSSATECTLRAPGAAGNTAATQYTDANFTNTTQISGSFDYLTQ